MVQLDNATRSQLKLLQKKEKNKRTFVKVTVLLLLDKGLSPLVISDYLGIDDATVYRYLKGYNEVGLKVYLEDHYQPCTGKLTEEQELRLKEEVTENLYINVKEIVAWVCQKFEVVYTQSGMTKLLHRIGFSYKKTKSVPSKADFEAQQKFLNDLNTKLEDLAENEVIYFNDGVHPQHNTRADYGWIPKGKEFEMPANTGRKRMNLSGALNATDVTDVEVLEADTINAEATIGLWEQINKKHPGKKITHICDNAAYYRSKKIQEYLSKNDHVTVVFLPSYSPNLNLIERLWKYLRKQVTSYFYYETYDEFRKAVLVFFANIAQHKPNLVTLLTLRFHIGA
jgi:transposase